MSKAPSDATMVRNLRSLLKQEQVVSADLSVELRAYRARATKAEQECAEWKARFDVLLRRENQESKP